MTERSAAWFRNVAIGGGSLALLMVLVLTLVMDAALPQWIHIPLAMLILGLLAAGPGIAGVAYLEYKARLVAGGKQT